MANSVKIHMASRKKKLVLVQQFLRGNNRLHHYPSKYQLFFGRYLLQFLMFRRGHNLHLMNLAWMEMKGTEWTRMTWLQLLQLVHQTGFYCQHTADRERLHINLLALLELDYSELPWLPLQ